MRYFVFFSLILLAACTDKQTGKPAAIIPGNWIVLYPEEELQTREQETVYAQTQDSFTGIRCLKLLRFTTDGKFRQLDSVSITGTWKINDKQEVDVQNGGRGFEPFTARIKSYTDNQLQLTELAEARGQQLQLNWHLLRIDKGDPQQLFDDAMNKWRYKPARKESDNEIRERVALMLAYYAVYFNLLSEESSYFIPGRVILPVNLYQHGIGLKEFDEKSKFAALFYNTEQAKFAWYVLDAAIDNTHTDFRKKDSFTAEYARWLELFALEVRKLIR